MKTTLGTEEVLYMALTKLRSVSLPFTIQTCAKLNINRIQSDIQAFSETKNELLKKYGSEKDGEYTINTRDKNWNDFYNDYVPLVSQEVELTLVECIYTHEDLLEILMSCEGIDQISISSQEIEALSLICSQKK